MHNVLWRVNDKNHSDDYQSNAYWAISIDYLINGNFNLINYYSAGKNRIVYEVGSIRLYRNENLPNNAFIYKAALLYTVVWMWEDM